MSKFKIGDTVVCNWGSGGAGYIKKGIVVDSNTKYNGNIEFSPNSSEEACVVRFNKGEMTWDGRVLGKNEVVPLRVIKKFK